MFSVTAAALERLSRKLARKKASDGIAMRFVRSAGGWKLGLDHSRPADTKFAHDGRDVLLLDGVVSKAMSRLTLDVRRTDSGPRLKLRRSTYKTE